MAITKLLLNGVTYDLGNTYEIKTEGPQIYEGRELSEYTWIQLKNKCTNVDFDDLRVGDYKTITLTNGEVVKMQIAGIDTYYNTAITDIPHHIDWISIDCLTSYYKWNLTNDNNGNSRLYCPYLKSNISAILNTEIWPMIPDDIKPVITDKKTLLESRYSESGALTDSNGRYWEDMGLLWIPSEYEVFGSEIWGTRGYSGGQHVQYPLFANSYFHRVKGRGNGGVQSTWWLATVCSNSSVYCCTVHFYGYAYFTVASYPNAGIPIGFRIVA